MQRTEDMILASLIFDEVYLRQVIPFLKDEYFTGTDRVLFDKARSFVEQYNAPPSVEALGIALQNDTKLSEQEFADVASWLAEVEKPAPTSEQWMLDLTEKFCKDRALYNAVVQSIAIIDGKDKDHTPDALPAILQGALSVSFDLNVGHDYDNDAEARWDFYHSDVERIPFDIDVLNQITKGGVPRKTLNVLIAGINVGKSLALCHLAAAYKALGKNVLYITMEMAEERIVERIDANILNIPLDDLPNLSKDMFMSRIKKMRTKYEGRLIVKEYPTASAHVGHFRALLNELALKQKFTPDVVIVDYLNICASSRFKIGGSVNSYTYIKGIAEELRGLAVERDIPLWTATQLTRTGMSSSDVDMTDTAESFGLPATADFMLAMMSSEEFEKLGQLQFKQLKNRYNAKVTKKRFMVGVDTTKMRLYGLEDSAQDGLMREEAEPVVRRRAAPTTAPGEEQDDGLSAEAVQVSMANMRQKLKERNFANINFG